MTGGSAQKAIDQLLARMNPGDSRPGRCEPGNKPGFADLTVFTAEAIDWTGAPPGSSASWPLRVARSATRAIAVVLVAAGATGALASTGPLDPRGLGEVREAATSSIAAREEIQPGGQQQPGSAAGGDAAGSEEVSKNDRRDEARNDGVAADAPGREEDWGADEAALAERWPELEEDAEKAIKQRFREVKEQVEQARQALDALGREMDQLHRLQHEEMQARHARERAEAAAEGAGAVEQAAARHQQQRAVLQRNQETERDRLAEAHDELDRHLQDARRDVEQARTEAVGGDEAGARRVAGRPSLHQQSGHQQSGVDEQSGRAAAEQPAAASPEQPTAANPVAAESGPERQSGQPHSGRTDDRQQQASATTEDPSGNLGHGPGMAAVAPEPTAPQTEPPALPQQLPQQQTPEPVVAAEPQRDDEEAAPAGQPPSSPSSLRAEASRDAPAGKNAAAEPAEAAEAAEAERPEAPEATAAPASEGAIESRHGAVPAGQDVADLVERGNALLDVGDLASARLFYRLAAGRGSAEGAMLMGMTFDPLYFARAGVHGTQPQIEDALEWYDKAIAMGSRPAEIRMGHLRSWLEHSAASGDAQAKAALQQLR